MQDERQTQGKLQVNSKKNYLPNGGIFVYVTVPAVKMEVAQKITSSKHAVPEKGARGKNAVSNAC